MDKTPQTQPADVLNEEYQGPAVTTAIAGEGYIAHFKWAGIGLVVGGITSALLHEPLGRMIGAARVGSQGLREYGANLNAKGKTFISKFPGITGGIGGWIFGRGEEEFVGIKNAIKASGAPEKYRDSTLSMIESKEKGIGHWLADHFLALFFIPPARRSSILSHTEQIETGFIGGGLLGALGFFCSPILYMGRGYQKGVAGKEQFHRLQGEVATTRAERDALLDKYAEVKTELDTVRRTGSSRDQDDGLIIAKDNPPAIDTPHNGIASLDKQADSPTGPTAPEIKPARTTGRVLDGVQADSPTRPSEPVIGPAPTTGRTLPEPPPRIQEPVIGPEHAEGWADRLAARDAEAAQHEAARV